MITEIKPQDIILNCQKTLCLPDDQGVLDDVLLAGLLRRSAGILCPCSRTALRSTLVESLNYIDINQDTLADRLDKLVDDLIVCGDLLELTEVAIDDPKVKGTWVFAAPPSFIVRSSGTYFLTGIVPDQDMFLPVPLAARVKYSACSRLITPETGENLSEVLSALGMIEHSEAVWLKAPNAENATSLISQYERRLAAGPLCGTISDLEILDTVRNVAYYPGRWLKPSDQCGNFVARRPQEFGAPLWCFVELANGVAMRFLDLPASHYRWRGCDAAWHLQMAIDWQHDEPQQYRRRHSETGVRLDFFSPLPQWAQRRLMVIGNACTPEKSLLAYEIPVLEAEYEERFLRERLWLANTECQ